MAQLNLSDEDLKKLAQSINDSSEPPYELIGKLFPSFMEKMRQDGKLDVEALNRYKIPTLEYAGKRSEGVILASASLLGEAAPLQIIRKFGDSEDNEWKNLIVQGDNLQFLKTVYLNQDPLVKDKVKGKVKLIYIDPPFGTGEEYGGSNGEMSYSAKLKGAEFIENLRESLFFLYEILSSSGLLLIRMDYHFGHYLKVILDEILGKDRFIDEIIIGRKRDNAGSRNKFEVSNESIFIYSKSSDYLLNDIYAKRSLTDVKWTSFLMAEERNPRERIFFGLKILPPKGQHFSLIQEKCDKLVKESYIRLRCKECGARFYYSESETDMSKRMKSRDKFKYYDINANTIFFGVKTIESCINCKGLNFAVEYLGSEDVKLNNIWFDIRSYSSTTEYPTENSEDLLERVILSCSNKNDLVLDVFAGSGTTAAVAEKLGRRWIMCDFGKHSIYVMQKRVFNISESKALGEDNKNKKYTKSPKPFAVVSAGAYDFTRIMDLRNNKEAYTSFVLSLFGIPKEDKDYLDKYKLDNIYAEKDGDPVEIFPVWDDEYLYDIRVDEDYLKEIIVQTKGRLKGNYYIIVPETCTLISNTKMNSSTGDEVYFNLLKFPYKILEEVSRNFAIEEQPDSPKNINNLISSVGFYFNDEVEIEVIKINGGFKVNNFKTFILNKGKQLYEGLEGLSLLLIDLNYDGNIFNIGKAVYQKELKNDGIVEIDGIGLSTAIIAVDKFGNESKPTLITER